MTSIKLWLKCLSEMSERNVGLLWPILYIPALSSDLHRRVFMANRYECYDKTIVL